MRTFIKNFQGELFWVPIKLFFGFHSDTTLPAFNLVFFLDKDLVNKLESESDQRSIIVDLFHFLKSKALQLILVELNEACLGRL